MIANHILHDPLDLLGGELLELVGHENIELGADLVNREESIRIKFLDKGFGHFFTKADEKRFQHRSQDWDTTELEEECEERGGRERSRELKKKGQTICDIVRSIMPSGRRESSVNFPTNISSKSGELAILRKIPGRSIDFKSSLDLGPK
jgi:hypothetical protein